jgi:hypothetical protein
MWGELLRRLTVHAVPMGVEPVPAETATTRARKARENFMVVGKGQRTDEDEKRPAANGFRRRKKRGFANLVACGPAIDPDRVRGRPETGKRRPAGGRGFKP